MLFLGEYYLKALSVGKTLRLFEVLTEGLYPKNPRQRTNENSPAIYCWGRGNVKDEVREADG